jgi:hypothetical protein
MMCWRRKKRRRTSQSHPYQRRELKFISRERAPISVMSRRCTGRRLLVLVYLTVGLTASFSYSETINAKEVRGTISFGETELELMKMAIRQLPSHIIEFSVGDDRHACQLSHIINPNPPPCNQPDNERIHVQPVRDSTRFAHKDPRGELSDIRTTHKLCTMQDMILLIFIYLLIY